MLITTRILYLRYRIVVVGAGAAGLAAARQLKFFGFDVLVLEARPRPCGRVMTHRRPDLELPPADLGAMIVMGLIGNPLVTLIQQYSFNVVRVCPKCPIYDTNGKLVDSRKDDMIQSSFNNILSTISYIVHGLGVTEIQDELLLIQNGNGEESSDGITPTTKGSAAPPTVKKQARKISLGEAFQLILDQHELRVQKRRLKYWEKRTELVNKLEDVTKKMQICRAVIDECMERFRQYGIPNLEEAFPEMFSIDFDESIPEAELQRRLRLRCTRICLQRGIKEHDEAAAEKREIEQVLSDFSHMEPSHVFMNAMDLRILDFHLANLEYAVGAPLNTVALKDWDLDEPFGFAGSHMTVKEGLGGVIERLGVDLKMEMNSVVEKIGYDEEGATVTYLQTQPIKSPTNGTQQQQEAAMIRKTISADAVLCTIPLGVLKKTPFLSDQEPDPGGAVQFEPPLPAWKREAIARLGFGSLNKLVLYFEKPFWDTNKSTFGRLNSTPSSRGELYLFFTNGDLPMLIGLFAGEAAASTGLEEKIVVEKGMQALHSIFGNSCPLQPLHFVVTQWHKDRFARGCYSYLSTGSLPDDYDTLARPLCPNGAEAAALPRVFFAGEHTNRQHPSTVHGAFLSGLREAGRIADTFIGSLSSDGEYVESCQRANETALLSEWNGMNFAEPGRPSTSQQQQSANQPQTSRKTQQQPATSSGGGGGNGGSPAKAAKMMKTG